jgi:DNA-binding response OmpR family regulator
MTGDILRQMGFMVAVASNASEALDYLKRHSVDLVLLDMVLENDNMDGLDLLKKFRG